MGKEELGFCLRIRKSLSGRILLSNRLTIFQKYPKWVIEDIKKMAERVGKSAYSLVTAKYRISLEEVKEVVKQGDGVNGSMSDSKPEDVRSNRARPAK